MLGRTQVVCPHAKRVRWEFHDITSREVVVCITADAIGVVVSVAGEEPISVVDRATHEEACFALAIKPSVGVTGLDTLDDALAWRCERYRVPDPRALTDDATPSRR